MNRSLIKTKIITFVILYFIAVFSANANLLQNKYPHWNLENNNQQKLAILDKFISENAGKGYVAIFDWDGTLYDEDIKIKEYKEGGIKAGQAAWHIWAAHHLSDKSLNLFPMFRTKEPLDGQIGNLILKDDYLEGKTNIQVEDYNKFSQIATLEAGMTPIEMTKGINLFLNEYPPGKYVFYPVLDVMQNLINAGFSVWIVTGSNPYFIAAVLNRIEGTLVYKDGIKYNFNISQTPYSPVDGKIVGNSAKLKNDGTFSLVYDDMFVKNSGENNLYVITEKGKRVAIETYIEKREGKKAIFCAGNSSGDYDMMAYILGNKEINSLGIAINPKGKLKKMIRKNPGKLLEFNMLSSNKTENEENFQ